MEKLWAGNYGEVGVISLCDGVLHKSLSEGNRGSLVTLISTSRGHLSCELYST